jgi:hypothetical protein
MAKRRRRTPKDPFAPPKKRAVADRKLLEGYAVDSLSPPNQLVPTGISGRDLYPLLGLQAVGDEAGDRAAHVFVHPRYGEYYWTYWNNCPPSWMDPMLLATMAKKDPKIRALLAACVKGNKKNIRGVTKELRRVFEEEYLPWMIDRFEQVEDLVAEWLILNAADEHVQEEENAYQAAQVDNRRRKRRKTRQAETPAVE